MGEQYGKLDGFKQHREKKTQSDLQGMYYFITATPLYELSLRTISDRLGLDKLPLLQVSQS